jgi:uncharacterized protein (UPF0276 family)
MTRVGLAYSGYLSQLLDREPACIDYVEVPVELLLHNPSALDCVGGKPVILHCASLNLAGHVDPSERVVETVCSWVERTGTPWVGEHLAFITADRAFIDAGADEYAPGEPYNLGFTVSPPMNPAAAAHVSEACQRYAKRLGTTLLIENSPIYFDMPGTTMTQVEFVQEICRQSPVRLLLDLTHFRITATNQGFDAKTELLRYPWERVEEIHISGSSKDKGVRWDDHSCTADDEIYDLLGIALERCRPKALTLEYNWSAVFPLDALLREIDRTRAALAGSRHYG